MNQIPLTSSAGTRKGDMLYRTLGRNRREGFSDWDGWLPYCAIRPY
jgi:hypothetical protein